MRYLTMTELQRPTLTLPADGKRLLLHSCCAPCSGEVMEAITASGIDYAIFFYNPNIHPVKEYELRKNENIRFAEQFGVPFVDADYDRDNWFSRLLISIMRAEPPPLRQLYSQYIRPEYLAAARTPQSLICCMFFQREMPRELVITGKPCSCAYSAVRSKRMSKHMVQRTPRSGSCSIPRARSNQLSRS